MKKILVIYNRTPNNFSGGNIRVQNTIKELSKYNKVTLLNFTSHNYRDLTRRIIFLILRRIHSSKSYLIKDHNYQVYVLRKNIKSILEKQEFDIIQVEHEYLAEVLNGIKTKSKKILVFHNIHSLMQENRLENKKLEIYEKKLTKIYDIAVCCSQEERTILKERGFSHVITVPNGVDVEYFKPNKKSKGILKLLFVGDLTYKPNIDGIKWFIKEIYPLLKYDINLEIIGDYKEKNLKLLTQKNNKIKLEGFKQEIRPYFTDSIFICPILSGGGTRLKILTAMSMGIPVVSTSKGAEGISYKNQENILIANKKEDFAKEIDQIIENRTKYDKIGKNARKLVVDNYDWKLVFKKYSDKINGEIK